MIRFGLVYVFVTVSVLAAGCSNPHPGSGRHSQALSYHFKMNNQCIGASEACGPEDDQRCEINRSFSSHEAYCAGLRDGASNEYCARSKRKAEYLRNCGNAFEDTNVVAILAESGDGSCATNRRLAEGGLTRTQICDGISKDMADHPCIREKHWYDRDIALYECQSN